MYEIALSVSACLRAGTKVDVAWVVETRGFSSRDRTEALAITPGGGRVGELMSGSLDDQIAELVRSGRSGEVVDLHVGQTDALVAGLSCGGDARCVIVPADELPADLWDRLDRREPVCLVTRLDGDRVVGTMLFTRETIGGAGEDAARLFGRAASGTSVAAESIVTVFWPVPRFVIVGAGAIVESLTAMGGLLGWQTQVVDGADAAKGALDQLAALDKVVVIAHDLDVGGPAIASALSGAAGYIGAVGSRATQRERAEWLAGRGITDLSRIHGPAGLDIGANTPPEIAVAIVAEALAAQSGRAAVSLRERPGPIHESG